jgi:hypothetical protein
MAKQKKNFSVQDYLNDMWENPEALKETIVRINGNYSNEFTVGWLTCHVINDSNKIFAHLQEVDRIKDHAKYIVEQVRLFLGTKNL